MFEKDLKLIALFDLYAGLLSEKKREAFEAYYAEDLSLSEIAESTGTSRQAVRDLLRRTSDELKTYEEKLGLFEKRETLFEIASELQKDGVSETLARRLSELI